MNYALHYLSSFAILFPILLGILNIHKLEKPEFKILLLYLIIFFLLDSIDYLISAIYPHSPFWIRQISPPLKLIFWIIIFRTNLNQGYSKLIGIIFLAGFFAYFLAVWFTYQQSSTLRTLILHVPLEASLVLLSIIFFYKTFQEAKINEITNDGMFWLSTSILIMYSGDILVILGAIILLNISKIDYLIGNFSAVLHIIFHLLLTFAIWKEQQKKSTSISSSP
jgi:hypothetical protein